MPVLFNAPTYTDNQIEALTEEEMTFPFSSRYMVYNSVKRQYIPTEALLIRHGVRLDDFLSITGRTNQEDINNELEYISDQVYAYIDKNSGSCIETLKWIVAKGIKRNMSPFRFRLLFEEILWKQARFYVDNDDPTKSTGLDVEQKQWLSKGVLMNEDRHIDPKIKMMIADLGLAWLGSYDSYYEAPMRREDW